MLVNGRLLARGELVLIDGALGGDADRNRQAGALIPTMTATRILLIGGPGPELRIAAGMAPLSVVKDSISN